MTDVRLTHMFIDHFPEKLTQDVVYISFPHALVAHLCCCGCGYEVVTPLAPREWKLTLDGVSVSLHPSIGNWSFPCKSHYWIRNNTVIWARQWTKEEISASRAASRATNQPARRTKPPVSAQSAAASCLAFRWWAALRKRKPR